MTRVVFFSFFFLCSFFSICHMLSARSRLTQNGVLLAGVPLLKQNNVSSRGLSTLPPLPPSETATTVATQSTSLGGLISTLAERLGVGELATGGLQLAVLGGLVAGARYFSDYFIAYLKKKTIVTAEFDSRDESYSWILNWLSEQPYSQHATQFSVTTTISRHGKPLTGEGIDSLLPAVYFLPAPGFHLLTYHRRLIWLSRERSQAAVVQNASSMVERIRISTFGRSRHILQQLVLDAQKQFIERDQSRTVVFSADQYGAWRRTRSRPKRPLNSIVIPSHIKTHLVDDAKEFLSSEHWYASRGIPFRRGYLLFGTPGSGKTSFVYSLAGELGLNIYVINLSNKSLTDDTLAELVCDTPSRCILLIEDVDAAFVQRTRMEGSKDNNITFSGLLNSIDGVSAQEGRILCMTTNHIDRLDDALIRPGRIDMRIHFGHATAPQARELFTKFYPHMPPKYISALAEQFSRKIPNETFSMAHLQGFLMKYKQHPEDALRHVDAWLTSQSKGSTTTSTTTEDDTSELLDAACPHNYDTPATSPSPPWTPGI
ncbi:BCS1 N terminal-domain-containing protein [Gongronella butleri]|nr:BCS1 N terminal-domain-containing protein [Gongronella butleri]